MFPATNDDLYHPVDPYRPSAALGVKNVLGGHEATIDDVRIPGPHGRYPPFESSYAGRDGYSVWPTVGQTHTGYPNFQEAGPAPYGAAQGFSTAGGAFRATSLHPFPEPYPDVKEEKLPAATDSSNTWLALFLAIVLDQLPRQLYLYALLGLPSQLLQFAEILATFHRLAYERIETAFANPLSRYAALLSLVCAFMSLLYGCIFIIRFGTMRRTHKAAEWAHESQKSRTSIFWNVWVMLALPALWLGWSLILFIVCIMSIVWQIGTVADLNPPQLVFQDVLPARVVVSVVLALGLVYLALVGRTFRRYGTIMDEAWKERLKGWARVGTAGYEPYGRVPGLGSKAPMPPFGRYPPYPPFMAPRWNAEHPLPGTWPGVAAPTAAPDGIRQSGSAPWRNAGYSGYPEASTPWDRYPPSSGGVPANTWGPVASAPLQNSTTVVDEDLQLKWLSGPSQNPGREAESSEQKDVRLNDASLGNTSSPSSTYGQQGMRSFGLPQIPHPPSFLPPLSQRSVVNDTAKLGIERIYQAPETDTTQNPTMSRVGTLIKGVLLEGVEEDSDVYMPTEVSKKGLTESTWDFFIESLRVTWRDYASTNTGNHSNDSDSSLIHKRKATLLKVAVLVKSWNVTLSREAGLIAVVVVDEEGEPQEATDGSTPDTANHQRRKPKLKVYLGSEGVDTFVLELHEEPSSLAQIYHVESTSTSPTTSNRPTPKIVWRLSNRPKSDTGGETS